MKTDPRVTVKLDYPKQLADRLLDEVTMRRPTLKDEIDNFQTDKDDLAAESRYFAKLTGLLPEDIELLDMEDYMRLQKLYVRFLTPAKNADGNSSSGPDAE